MAEKRYIDANELIPQMQAENERLKTLLDLAADTIASLNVGIDKCSICFNNNVGENEKYCRRHDFDCKNCEVLQGCKCGQCHNDENWEWEHADKLKEFGAGV